MNVLHQTTLDYLIGLVTILRDFCDSDSVNSNSLYHEETGLMHEKRLAL